MKKLKTLSIPPVQQQVESDILSSQLEVMTPALFSFSSLFHPTQFHFFYLLAIIILTFTTSCFKEDKIAPIIQLIGLPIVTVPIGTEYIEQGTIAEDDRDGDITYLVKTTGSPNTEIAGQYFVRYNVHDAAGNHAAETARIVYVVHQNYSVEAIYEVTESCNLAGMDNYFITITAGSGKELLYLKNFNDLPGSNIAFANLSGNTRQSITLTDMTVADTVYSGSGLIDSTGTEIIFDFTKTYNSIVDSCSLILKR